MLNLGPVRPKGKANNNKKHKRAEIIIECNKSHVEQNDILRGEGTRQKKVKRLAK